MKPFSITFVEYEEDSIASLVLALVSLTPIFAVIGHASILLVKRDLQAITLFLGVLLCVVLNEVLKHILKEPRPIGSRKDGHGMPSNHSQLSFFFAVSLLLIWQRWKMEPVWRRFLSFAGISAACLVAFARVFHGVHSVAQISVGAIVGTLFAFVWDFITDKFLRPLFPKIQSLALCQYLYIYDGSQVENQLKFEYDNYTAQQKKQKKN
eukprot:TRINITY_DN16013_c0_g1_i1.p1 TRINITY_DN16013_c0_g1~~TRINITY_DN16013_c0_g1_i1.p1  ORF type:complete len:209 (-),score=40.27 TRINITY_DN16013_c0_g1_i1:2-628(-)